MLGVTDSYISGCRQLFGRLRDAKSINPVAYADSQVIWIHVIHPSPGAQNHYKDWLTGTGTKLSQKRQYAKAALRERGLQLAALDLGHTATLRPAVVGEDRAQHPDSTERRPNMVTERELFGVFDQAGFANTKDLKRTAEFRCRKNERYVYVDKDFLQTGRIRVFIEDSLPKPPRITGVEEKGIKFRSNLTEFSTQKHGGKKPEHYGRAFDIDDKVTLLVFLQWFSNLS